MNTQNILQKRGTIDLSLDTSEYYDYEIVENQINIDVVLDYSQYYDYTLGDNDKDYVFPTVPFIIPEGPWIITDKDAILITDDKYYIEYY